MGGFPFEPALAAVLWVVVAKKPSATTPRFAGDFVAKLLWLLPF